MATKKAVNVSEPTNAAQEDIQLEEPYIATIRITGVADLLFHRWDNQAVKSKTDAAKGSKAKKSDNTESYLWRDDDGVICLPGEYLRQSLIHSAKFSQDPRSPRKSAMDLFKAGVVTLTNLAPLGKDAPDYFDSRRVVVQRNAVTRTRPAFRAGWSAEIQLQVITPEYISTGMLHDVISRAGRLVGVGDFRPTFGRFRIDEWSVA